MKICVLSDTHIPCSSNKIPKRICEEAKTCDLIIHCGDLTEEDVLEHLRSIAETKVVCGNMDSPQLKKTIPQKEIIKVAGKKIGVVHSSGPPAAVKDKAREEFKGEKLDVIIFGHSHTPMNETQDGVLYFNPGSACDTVFAPYRSFGVIEIADGKITARIIKLEGKEE